MLDIYDNIEDEINYITVFDMFAEAFGKGFSLCMVDNNKTYFVLLKKDFDIDIKLRFDSNFVLKSYKLKSNVVSGINRSLVILASTLIGKKFSGIEESILYLKREIVEDTSYE